VTAAQYLRRGEVGSYGNNHLKMSLHVKHIFQNRANISLCGAYFIPSVQHLAKKGGKGFAFQNGDDVLRLLSGVQLIMCLPIIVSGNIAGGILFLSADGLPGAAASEAEISLVQAFAAYLGKQLDD